MCLRGQLRHQVIEESDPGPLLQLAELFGFVAGGLGVDELVEEPFPELRSSPEQRRTG